MYFIATEYRQQNSTVIEWRNLNEKLFPSELKVTEIIRQKGQAAAKEIAAAM